MMVDGKQPDWDERDEDEWREDFTQSRQHYFTLRIVPAQGSKQPSPSSTIPNHRRNNRPCTVAVPFGIAAQARNLLPLWVQDH